MDVTSAAAPRAALAQAASVNITSLAGAEELTKIAVAADGAGGSRSDTGDGVAPATGASGTLGALNSEAIASIQHALGLHK